MKLNIADVFRKIYGWLLIPIILIITPYLFLYWNEIEPINKFIFVVSDMITSFFFASWLEEKTKKDK